MLALHQTMTLPAARSLRLGDILPGTLSAGQVEVKVFIQPQKTSGVPSPETREELSEQQFEKSFYKMGLNRESLEHPLPPLRGIAKGCAFTVDSLLEERRRETRR